MNKLTVMAPTEAREITNRIKNNLTSARRLLLEMYERKGWKALGYESWREYGQNEFGYSESRIYQLMDAAKVERNISTIVEKQIPEGQLRPLTKLEPEQQIEAWQEVVDTAPNGKVTAAHVEQVVNKKTAHVSHNSGENEWYTPPEIIEAARNVMGEIDVDPASSEMANQVIQAKTYYTIESDGLAWDWYGKVWMNPPYSQPLISHFCEKLTTDLMMGFVTEAITLTNNATETRWFQELTGYCSAVCFPTGRIKFIDVNGEFGNAPLQGQAIMYFGNDIERFEAEFKRFGPIFYASRQDSI